VLATAHSASLWQWIPTRTPSPSAEIASRDGLRARLGRGTDASQRVLPLGAVAVEEVLGVVDDPLTGADKEGDRGGDHPQVLLAVDLDELLEVQRPGLADDRADRRNALRQLDQRGIALSFHVAAVRHPERCQHGVVQAFVGHQLEELSVLWIRAGEAGLDQVDSELVEPVGDAHLLLGREGHALSLHAVAQGGVV
jgi:hypothetical protein